MIVVVFGASGKVGRLVVAEALRREHSVRAVFHKTKPDLDDDNNLDLIQVDRADAEAVTKVIIGAEAVISTLGSWGTASKDIVSVAAKHYIPAMETQGITRIISLTGAEAYDITDKLTPLRRITRTAARLVAHKILFDGEEHIRLLRASKLDWTVLRSPVMTSRPRTDYKLSLTAPKPWNVISRRAVANALLDQLDGPAYSRAAPFIYND